MIAFITNLPTPQKNYLFNLLHKELKGNILFFFSALKSEKRKGWEKYLRDIHFPYEVIENKTFINPLSKDFATISIIKKFPDFRKFKIVIISGGLNILEFSIAKRLLELKIPYIVWTESFNLTENVPIFLPIRYFFRKFLFKNAIAVVCGSNMSLKHVKSFGVRNAILNYSTFDIYKFDFHKVHKGSFLNILFVGRLIERKRVFDILRALKNVENYKFDIIGSGPLLEKLKKFSKENNLVVNFLGDIEYEEMPKIYKNYDILILPSKNEVFGYVVIEAIMSSVVPIVSNQVGAKDFVRENFQIKVGDINSLREKILMLRDENLRNELISYSKNLVLNYAKPEIWVKKFIDLIS
ncbi:MAG: glycosyltransferase family 4 protein [candidate division WOR-3 bacterium]